jgi:hypothetical protein
VVAPYTAPGSARSPGPSRARRVRELSDWLAALTGTAPRRVWRVVRKSARRGVASQTSPRRVPYSRRERTLIKGPALPHGDRTRVLIVAWGAAPGLVVLPGAVPVWARVGPGLITVS